MINFLKSYFKKKDNTEIQEDTLFDTTTLVKLDRNKLFKGHAGNLTQNGIDGGTLYFSNTYFSGHVFQTYLVRKNITTSMITYKSYTPKWLANKIYDATSSNVNDLAYNSFNIRTDDLPKIEMNPHECSISKETVNDGLSFTGHYQNLDDIKELSFIWRSLRIKIKGMTSEQLRKNLIKCPDTNEFILNKYLL
tara:strand:+ start:4071 stop:4649 length:579 start_codon:yes stop_codon:yes gene_type:complete